MAETLLPPSIRDARTSAVEAQLARLDALPLDLLRQLHDPATCAAEALPYLAQAFGVLDEVWALARTEAEQRALVGQALLWQRHRGTPWALSQVLTAAGWPGGVIQERVATGRLHDGSFLRDGAVWYGGSGGSGGDGWATFRVQFDLGQRVLGAGDVALLHAVVAAWSPVGRHCAELLLRLQLSGGLAPGRTAADAAQIQAGSCTRAISGCSGNLVRARLRRHEAPGEDLRTFRLLDASGATVAEVTRASQLVHVNHTLYLEWSL